MGGLNFEIFRNDMPPRASSHDIIVPRSGFPYARKHTSRPAKDGEIRIDVGEVLEVERIIISDKNSYLHGFPNTTSS